MARNAAGVYSLPDAPVVSGTTITAVDENTTRSDIATELTNSLDRNGRGAMLAPLQLFDGLVNQPGLTFATDTNSGIYRIGPDNYALVANGAKVLEIAITGIVITGTITGLTSLTASVSVTTVGLTATGTVALAGATITGAPTWGSTQVMNISGNAATVTTNANLTGPITSVGNATSIASGNTYTNPTLSGTVSGTPSWASTQSLNTSGSSASCTGNAATATKLQTARNLNGVAFDGTASITVPFQPDFEAGPASLVAGTDSFTAHSLGVRPRLIRGVLRCISTDLGYAIGDEVPVESLTYNGTTFNTGITMYCNATNVGFVLCNTGQPIILNRTGGSVGVTGAITLANWNMIMRCWK